MLVVTFGLIRKILIKAYIASDTFIWISVELFHILFYSLTKAHTSET